LRAIAMDDGTAADSPYMAFVATGCCAGRRFMARSVFAAVGASRGLAAEYEDPADDPARTFCAEIWDMARWAADTCGEIAGVSCVRVSDTCGAGAARAPNSSLSR
jgi:hypothetical protein